MTQVLVDMAPNGRMVIPRQAREALGITGEERFLLDQRDGSIVLTPVVVVPVDRSFPITPELVASANRAAAEPIRRTSRSKLRQKLSDITAG